MRRNHIHFAPREPTDKETISGMRTSCELLVYLDVPRVLADGVPFFRSDNDVLLTPGVGEAGVLPPKYFEKVVDRKSGKVLFMGRELDFQGSEAGVRRASCDGNRRGRLSRAYVVKIKHHEQPTRTVATRGG